MRVSFPEMRTSPAKTVTSSDEHAYFLPGDRCFLCGDAYFLRGDACFLSGDACFPCEDVCFLSGDAYFFPEDGCFRSGDRYFVWGDRWFRLVNQRRKASRRYCHAQKGKDVDEGDGLRLPVHFAVRMPKENFLTDLNPVRILQLPLRKIVQLRLDEN